MTEVLVLNDSDVRRLHEPAALFDALADALRSLSAGEASVPPRVAAHSPTGLLGAMPGHVPGAGMGAKLVTYFRDNHAHDRPAHQAIVALFDPEDGTPRAVMDGTYITAARTATSAAVAARALAEPGARSLAVVGAGVQGRAHLAEFTRVFDADDVRVASRTPEHADALAAGHDRARAVPTFEEAVRDADVVCLCTDSDTPVVSWPWLRPGAHVSSVGSGHEVDPETIAAASVFVESRAVATSPFPAGSRELSGRDPATVTEVGEVLLGRHPGRRSTTEVTVYKSMGHAVEDVAAASLVHAAALATGAGIRVDL